MDTVIEVVLHSGYYGGASIHYINVKDMNRLYTVWCALHLKGRAGQVLLW